VELIPMPEPVILELILLLLLLAMKEFLLVVVVLLRGVLDFSLVLVLEISLFMSLMNDDVNPFLLFV